MTNELVYAAYGVSSIPSERMLEKLPIGIKDQFKRDKVDAGIKVKTIELNKERGASAVVVVTYFPKFREEKEPVNQLFQAKIEQSLRKASRLVGGEFKPLGELPKEKYAVIHLPLYDYELSKTKSTERYVIESSSDIFNRFSSKFTRSVDRHLEELGIYAFTSLENGNELHIYSLYPVETLSKAKKDKMNNDRRNALIKSFKEIKCELESDEMLRSIENIYIKLRKKTEDIYAEKMKERRGCSEITIQFNNNVNEDKVFAKQLRKHLLADKFCRIRSAVSYRERNLVNMKVKIVYPYATHKTDNVSREFERIALELMDDMIHELNVTNYKKSKGFEKDDFLVNPKGMKKIKYVAYGKYEHN